MVVSVWTNLQVHPVACALAFSTFCARHPNQSNYLLLAFSPSVEFTVLLLLQCTLQEDELQKVNQFYLQVLNEVEKSLKEVRARESSCVWICLHGKLCID